MPARRVNESGATLVWALLHVPVDVRAARAMCVGRDVERDLDVMEDQLEMVGRGQLLGERERTRCGEGGVRGGQVAGREEEEVLADRVT